LLKKFVPIILCLCLIVIAAGCTKERRTESDTSKEPKADANAVMNDFHTLAQKNSSVIEEVANFINNNISKVSKEDASKMGG